MWHLHNIYSLCSNDRFIYLPVGIFDMGALRNLADLLGESEYCVYSNTESYLSLEDNQIIRLKPKELIKVGMIIPVKEQVLISCFDDLPTRVVYVGEDVEHMRKTVEKLRLPRSWSTNLGEKVFCLFNGHLKYINSGPPVFLEYKVVSGKEHQFRVVLRKLIDMYKKEQESYDTSLN